MTSLICYVGFDHREPLSYRVAVESLHRHSATDLDVRRITDDDVRKAGLYWREYDEIDGQRYDKIDGKPFSTDFAFCRFLIPHLCRNEEGKWALFFDGDFLFRESVGEILECVDEHHAVVCVKHQHYPTETTKMDGQAQQQYWRKNWSSAICWNLRHPANEALTPDLVNSATGAWLHGFSWLKDEQIGALPVEWNYLVGYNTPLQCPEPAAVHFTTGTPELGHMYAGTPDERYALEWLEIADQLGMREQIGAKA